MPRNWPGRNRHGPIEGQSQEMEQTFRFRGSAYVLSREKGGGENRIEMRSAALKTERSSATRPRTCQVNNSLRKGTGDLRKRTDKGGSATTMPHTPRIPSRRTEGLERGATRKNLKPERRHRQLKKEAHLEGSKGVGRKILEKKKI